MEGSAVTGFRLLKELDMILGTTTMERPGKYCLKNECSEQRQYLIRLLQARREKGHLYKAENTCNSAASLAGNSFSASSPVALTQCWNTLEGFIYMFPQTLHPEIQRQRPGQIQPQAQASVGLLLISCPELLRPPGRYAHAQSTIWYAKVLRS